MINVFTGTNRFLSNFYPAPLTINGLAFATAEHAYQAAKAVNDEDRERIRNAKTPGDAKRLGRKIECRPDWEARRVSEMLTILRAKFSQNPDLAARLIQTGDQQLIESNTWGDRFWGVCAGVGANELGKALMLVRTELLDR